MNIQAVARRTGVPAATLRKWEERYGVPAPSRTEGAQRNYGERELRQIEWLRDRLAEGIRIGHAAAMLQRLEEPFASADDLRDAILDALTSRAPSRIEALVDQAFAAHEPETGVSEVVAPVLERVGDLWEQGAISVAEEHFVSQLVATKVRSLVDTTANDSAGVAVLACVPRERHELGLLCLAALLQRDGWRVVYLGQDTPLEDAFELAAGADARVLGLSGTMGDGAEECAEDLERFTRAFPSVSVQCGGAAFGGQPADRAVQSLRRLRPTAQDARLPMIP